MSQIREEIYNQDGLVEVKFHEVENELTPEEIIAKKEAELLAMYTELEALKEANKE